MSVTPETLIKHSPNIVLGLLAVLMVGNLSYQAFHFFDQPETDSQQGGQQVPPPKLKHNYHFKNIEIFGVAPISALAPQQTEDLPETNLQLTLRGISSSNENIKDASALIEDNSRRTLRYKIGDSLPGGAKIVSIYTKRIVIERRGKKENLFFPEYKSIGIAKQNIKSPALFPTYSVPQPITIPKDFEDYAVKRAASGLDQLSDERKQEIRSRLEKLRQKMNSSR